jgi:predicted O-methyltransferase YrrM
VIGLVAKELNLEDLLTKEPFFDAKPLYDLLYDFSDSYKKYFILQASMDIGLFDRLGEPKTVSDLAKELETELSLLQKICDCLSIMGFLTKEKGFYKNTEISNLYLRAGSPMNQHNVFKNLHNGLILWDKLAEIARQGPVLINEEKFFSDNLIHSLAEEAICGELQRTVSIVAGLPGFQKAKTILDLGGGHGMYAIAFSKLNPDLQAYVYDFPDVTQNTRTYIQKHKADRVDVIQGNFFTDDLYGEYDVVFFSSNPGGKNPRLVPKIHACLKEGGLFINKHCFYRQNDGTKNCLLDIEWNLTSFAGVQKGQRIYSFKEDLSFEDYMNLLNKYFTIKRVIEAPAFKGYPLSKIGDALDSKIIISEKNKSTR